MLERRKLRGRVLRAAVYFLPTALLICVGLSQVYLAHVQQLLTPAKGGGFGLFSTVDKLVNRSVRAYVIEYGWETPISMPRPVPLKDTLGRPTLTAASLPSDSHLLTLAKGLAARNDEVDFRAVRVEVWKLAFDAETMQISRIKVRERRALRSRDADD